MLRAPHIQYFLEFMMADLLGKYTVVYGLATDVYGLATDVYGLATDERPKRSPWECDGEVLHAHTHLSFYNLYTT